MKVMKIAGNFILDPVCRAEDLDLDRCSVLLVGVLGSPVMMVCAWGGKEEAGVRAVCVGMCMCVHCVLFSPSQPPRGNEGRVLRAQQGRKWVGGRASVCERCVLLAGMQASRKRGKK